MAAAARASRSEPVAEAFGGNLDGDLVMESRVERAIDRAHSALAQESFWRGRRLGRDGFARPCTPVGLASLGLPTFRGGQNRRGSRRDSIDLQR